jgi:hypothetical protein
MIKLKQILLESPHAVHLEYLSYDDDDAIAFSYYNNKWNFIENKFSNIGTHMELPGEFQAKYAGRYWSQPKIMSFWEYPTSKLLILKLLNLLKQITKDVKIEVIYNNNNSLQTRKYDIEKATVQIQDVIDKNIDADECDYYSHIMSVEEYIRKYCK